MQAARAGEVGLIDLERASSGAAPKVLARAADTALALAITGDGRQVAAGGADKLIRLIDVASGQEVRQLAQHSDWVMGLAYNADGTQRRDTIDTAAPADPDFWRCPECDSDPESFVPVSD